MVNCLLEGSVWFAQPALPFLKDGIENERLVVYLRKPGIPQTKT